MADRLTPSQRVEFETAVLNGGKIEVRENDSKARLKMIERLRARGLVSGFTITAAGRHAIGSRWQKQ